MSSLRIITPFSYFTVENLNKKVTILNLPRLLYQYILVNFCTTSLPILSYHSESHQELSQYKHYYNNDRKRREKCYEIKNIFKNQFISMNKDDILFFEHMLIN